MKSGKKQHNDPDIMIKWNTFSEEEKIMAIRDYSGPQCQDSFLLKLSVNIG